jgi:hypothetical protein
MQGVGEEWREALGLALTKIVFYTKVLSSLCYFHSGFEYAVESGKSLVIACALAEKEISVERATSLSRLEVEFQVSLSSACKEIGDQYSVMQ